MPPSFSIPDLRDYLLTYPESIGDFQLFAFIITNRTNLVISEFVQPLIFAFAYASIVFVPSFGDAITNVLLLCA
jgi:hypothetical protein